MDYEILHKETLQNLQRLVSKGVIPENEAKAICRDFVAESEDERIMKALVSYIRGEGGYPYDVDDFVSWLEKKGEQKPEWSEDDENHLDSIIDTLKDYIKDKQDMRVLVGVTQDNIFWVKSLKERVEPQLKQDWCEKDKCMLNNVIDTLKPLSQTTHSGYSINSMIDWLKSLRPRKQWKPSEEQMNLLQAIVNEPNNAASESCQMVLKEVIRQLKAL